MSLSVHLLRIVQDKDFAEKYDPYDDEMSFEIRESYTIFRRDEDITLSQEKLFERFKDFVVKKKFEVYDFEKSWNINVDEYEFLGEENDYSIFKDNVTGEVLRFENDKLVTKDVIVDTLVFKEIKSFKRCNKKEFWEWSKLDDFDDLGNRYNAITSINSIEEFEEALKHFDDNAPIHDWELFEDEVIYFSW